MVRRIDALHHNATGRVAIFNSTPCRMRSLRSARRPVVFFYNGVGDHLLTLPTIRALAAIFPNRLRLISCPQARGTYFADLPLDDVLEIEFSRVNGVRHFEAQPLAARIGYCDLFLSLAPWHSRSIDELLSLVVPTYSIGFSPTLDEVLLINSSKHSADRAFEVARRLDGDLRLESFWGPPGLPAEVKRDALAIRSRLPPEARLLIVHGDTGRVKMWDVEKWKTFLDLVLEHCIDFAVLVVGLSPVVTGEWRHDSRVLPVSGTSLATSLALVGLAKVFVGVDSCMLHAADLYRVPGVGLFGPTTPQQWGFRFARGCHVRGAGTMESITIDQALRAFLQVLNGLEADNQSQTGLAC